MSKLKPYTSGYMKPPKEHQFKKGKSGNPKGRPKEPDTVQKAVARVLKRKVKAGPDGRTVTILDALAIRLRQEALKGNRRAFNLHLRIAELRPQENASVSDQDMAEMKHRYYEKMLKEIQEKQSDE